MLHIALLGNKPFCCRLLILLRSQPGATLLKWRPLTSLQARIWPLAFFTLRSFRRKYLQHSTGQHMAEYSKLASCNTIQAQLLRLGGSRMRPPGGSPGRAAATPPAPAALAGSCGAPCWDSVKPAQSPAAVLTFQRASLLKADPAARLPDTLSRPALHLLPSLPPLHSDRRASL